MIKARDLIKKERKDMYTANNEDSYNKYQVLTKESDSLWGVCLFKAHSLYDNKYGLNESAKRYKKVTKLAKRLEREFLRGEGNEYIGVIELIYIESSDIDDIFNESVFFKGEINIKNINHLIKSFNSDKERLENIFKSEYGTYHFGVIENAIADRYEFELIDFKPLEVESE